MINYKNILLNALQDHQQLKKQYNAKIKKLAAFDGLFLTTSHREGKTYYSCFYSGGKRRYLGREGHDSAQASGGSSYYHL